MPINWITINVKDIDKYPYVVQWFKCLKEQSVTEIICYNFILDCKNGCCSDDTKKKYLKTLNEVLKSKTYEVIKKTLPRDIFREVRKKINVCLEGKQTNISGEDRFCRIYEKERFNYYVKDMQPKYLEDQDEGYTLYNQALISLESRAGFLWITSGKNMDEILGENPNEKQWKRALEITGLDNKGSSGIGFKNEYTIVFYPSSIPKIICQPTFVEGGDNPLFRIQPTYDGWNRAVDVCEENFGCPGHLEAIHSKEGLVQIEYKEFSVSPSEEINYEKLNKIIKEMVNI